MILCDLEKGSVERLPFDSSFSTVKSQVTGFTFEQIDLVARSQLLQTQDHFSIHRSSSFEERLHGEASGKCGGIFAAMRVHALEQSPSSASPRGIVSRDTVRAHAGFFLQAHVLYDEDAVVCWPIPHFWNICRMPLRA
jgi:hypothetical protein